LEERQQIKSKHVHQGATADWFQYSRLLCQQ